MDSRIEHMVVNLIKNYHDIKRHKKKDKTIKSVLIIRYDHLGDMVCTTPFLRGVRESYSEAQITLICSPEVYNYIEYTPFVDEIITYNPIISGKHIFERNIWQIRNFIKEKFLDREFDIAFVPRFPDSPTERIFAYLLDTVKVLSYVPCNDGVYISDTTVESNAYEVCHEVMRGINLLTAAGGHLSDSELGLWVTEDDQRKAAELFSQNEILASDLCVVVCLSTSANAKNWDVKKYAEVCRGLQTRYDAQIILLGAKSDTWDLGVAFCKLVDNVHNFIGKTTIRQTCAVMQMSDVYIGGDTGTMHLAAAVKIPGVVITKDYIGAAPKYGAALERFAPWQSEIQIIRPKQPLPGCEVYCAAGEAHCINQIMPNEVMYALEKIIENRIKTVAR